MLEQLEKAEAESEGETDASTAVKQHTASQMIRSIDQVLAQLELQLGEGVNVTGGDATDANYVE